ncbi:MAG: hypothetical protein HOA04_07690 [Euryarchaeota archaeon]|nr:hypothetical protein [Euryarchaeota archaeon]MBT7937797.1 hypothetical protein [Euryarchaeota archaeon]
MSRRSFVALLMISLMLISIPSSATAQSDDAITDDSIKYTNEEIKVKLDETVGELSLKLGDAKMRLSWGTAEEPGEISLFTTQTHFMGVADLYDSRGRFDKRVGIPVNTAFYQKLDGIIEYDDLNNDGLFNVKSQGKAGTLDEITKANVSHESIMKYISYSNLTWTPSVLTEECNGNVCQFDFSLEATSISYQGNDVNASQSLDLIKYIFHITTTETAVEVEAMPHYRVETHKDRHKNLKIDYTKQIGSSNITADVLKNVWKYDQILEGWDASTNESRLMTVVEYGMGAYMKDSVAEWTMDQFQKTPGPKPFVGQAKKDSAIHTPPPPPKNVHDKFGHPLKCGGSYVEMGNNGQGNEQKDSKKFEKTHCSPEGEELMEEGVSNASVVRAGGLHFDNDGAKMASIRWVSNATVDGVEEEVLFQVHGIRPINKEDLQNSSLPNGHYKGVRMIGGYNHPVGENITHDPEYDIDVMTIDTAGFGEPIDLGNRFLFRNLMQIAPIVMGAIVVGIAGTVLMVRRKAKKAALIPKAEDFPSMGTNAERGSNWHSYVKQGDS